MQRGKDQDQKNHPAHVKLLLYLWAGARQAHNGRINRPRIYTRSATAALASAQSLNVVERRCHSQLIREWYNRQFPYMPAGTVNADRDRMAAVDCGA